MIGVRIPAELKALVDADRRTNQEVVEAALWTEFGGESKGAVDRRINEIDRRIEAVETERQNRDREIEELRNKKESLQTKKSQMQEARDSLVAQCADTLAYLPEDETDPAVVNWAEKADMTPEAFYAELTQVMDDE